MKKKLLFLFLVFYFTTATSADVANVCLNWPSLFQPACRKLHQIWYEGNNDLYVTGYAWHNRYTYPKEKIKRYNELAWGGGLGKGLYDEKGNWHGIYAIAFLDSHKNIEPTVGYAYLKVARLNETTRLGAGFTVLITQRADILNGIPFPGALPWLSISYRNLSIYGTYVPRSLGSNDNGNVLFLLSKWTFNGV